MWWGGPVLGMCLPHRLSATSQTENPGAEVSMLAFAMSWE